MTTLFQTLDAIPMRWETPLPERIDRDAEYLVWVDQPWPGYELWTGHLLYSRLRPEFVVGRAKWVAKIEEPTND